MHKDKKRRHHIDTLGSIALHNRYTSTLVIMKISFEVMDLSLVLGKNTLGHLLSQGPAFRSSNSTRCLDRLHETAPRKKQELLDLDLIHYLTQRLENLPNHQASLARVKNDCSQLLSIHRPPLFHNYFSQHALFFLLEDSWNGMPLMREDRGVVL